MAWVLIIAIGLLWLWYTNRGQSATQTGSGGFMDLGGVPSSGGSALGPIQQMAQAIYQFEGGGKPGATNEWNNNPGNIGGGQTTYPTQQAGWNALYSYIQRHVQANPGWTFQNFFAYYLTGDANNLNATNQGDPVSYASYVASQLGASPDQTVSSVVGA